MCIFEQFSWRTSQLSLLASRGVVCCVDVPRVFSSHVALAGNKQVSVALYAFYAYKQVGSYPPRAGVMRFEISLDSKRVSDKCERDFAVLLLCCSAYSLWAAPAASVPSGRTQCTTGRRTSTSTSTSRWCPSATTPVPRTGVFTLL